MGLGSLLWEGKADIELSDSSLHHQSRHTLKTCHLSALGS